MADWGEPAYERADVNEGTPKGFALHIEEVFFQQEAFCVFTNRNDISKEHKQF